MPNQTEENYKQECLDYMFKQAHDLHMKFNPSYKPKKKTVPVRVKINGEFFHTPKGKTIWPSIGAAKNAIHNHISVSKGRPMGMDYSSHSRLTEEVMKEFFEKYCEFIPFN